MPWVVDTAVEGTWLGTASWSRDEALRLFEAFRGNALIYPINNPVKPREVTTNWLAFRGITLPPKPKRVTPEQLFSRLRRVDCPELKIIHESNPTHRGTDNWVRRLYHLEPHVIPTLEDIIRGLLDGSMSPELARSYLACYEQMQAEADSIGNVPLTRAAVVLDTIKKCDEQDRRWGPRRYPSFDEMLTDSADTTPQVLAGYYNLYSPESARQRTDALADLGQLTWADILLEEVSKLTEYFEDTTKLRAQIIDVAGVATQWAAQLTEIKVDFITQDEAGVEHREEIRVDPAGATVNLTEVNGDGQAEDQG